MPMSTEPGGGRRLALVIATASYADATLAKLRAPGRDASDVAGVLSDAAVGGFEVEMVLDAPTEALRRRVARFCADLGPADLTLLYLSCHGVLDDRGRLYYATVDTDHALLSATAVSSAWLNEQLEDCRCRRQILVLDCCHSGAFAKGAKGESGLALGQRFEGRGRVVLTGSRGTEYSFEHDRVVGDGASSVFSSALVKGLRSGDADLDGDGVVTISELYEYAYDAVRAKEARQTPTLWSYGAEGDLLVARSPRGAAGGPQRSREGPGSPGGGVLDLVPASTPAPSVPPKRGFPGRRRGIAVAAAALLAAAVVAVAVGLTGGGRRSQRPLPTASTIHVPGSPRGIAVADSGLWVSSYDRETVYRVEPSSKLRPAEVDGHPDKLVAGEGSVWVALDGGKTLERIDPESLDVTETIPIVSETCECAITELAIAQGTLWASSEDAHTITGLDLETGDDSKRYKLNATFEGVFAVGDDEVWAAGNDESKGRASLFPIAFDSTNASDSDKSAFTRPDSYFAGVAYGDGTVWIADSNRTRNEVTAFDPDTEKEADSIEGAEDTNITGDNIAVVGDGVLTWDPDFGRLTLFNPSTGKAESHPPLPQWVRGRVNHSRSDMTVNEESAWVTNPAGDAIDRIDYGAQRANSARSP
jgi:uncharacterized caspase-like protein